MLVFGPYRACATLPKAGDVLLNFSSLNQDIPRLNALMPGIPEAVLYDPYQADQWYFQYIMTNDVAFIEMMNIMMPLYEGRNVYICISGEVVNQFISIMNELLMKFISARYGYNCVLINESDDIEFFDPGDFHFNVPGIMNMDIDRERWSMMSEVTRLRGGGVPYK